MGGKAIIARSRAAYVLADGDDEAAYRDDEWNAHARAHARVMTSASRSVRLALARRSVEDAADDPRAWYALGAEAFAVGDFASCEFALTQPCVRDAYGASEPRFWLRLSHAALALNGDVRERVDATLDCVDGLDGRVDGVAEVARAIALDAALVEKEWARRQNREPRPRAKAILDGGFGAEGK